jgi:hypothetical protein
MLHFAFFRLRNLNNTKKDSLCSVEIIITHARLALRDRELCIETPDW